VLAGVGYTQLKTISAEEGRGGIFGGGESGPFYLLGNKVGQKERKRDGADQGRGLIFRKLMEGCISPQQIFSVSVIGGLSLLYIW
ncbi:clamp-binding protein CrfC, partial [Escherichia coli]|nr:clamp-binding protein CrfC [Escherichia coli]